MDDQCSMCSIWGKKKNYCITATPHASCPQHTRPIWDLLINHTRRSPRIYN
uniref:Uncharacterized protein n=1 Tax=Anguilla anguilla TaxID=7936 RepID=A0A0E9VJ64_ANGAN